MFLTNCFKLTFAFENFKFTKKFSRKYRVPFVLYLLKVIGLSVHQL